MDTVESITPATSESSSAHGPSVPRLPVEVCGRIIDHIAMKWHDGNITGDPYLTTLTSCALVCQDWYFLTCYHLHQYIYLRDRKDVLSLSKSLQARPRFREIVQVVFISGASIRHLGTVAAMLAGKAPKLWRIGIKDAEWTIRSVRMEDISYLAASNSIEALDLSNVTLSSVAQLSRLVSALRRLRHIQCFRVDFLQEEEEREEQVSPASLPPNCANLEILDVRWVARAVEDLFVQIRASRVRDLEIGVNHDLDPLAIWAPSRSQTLLNAHSTSAQTVVLHMQHSYPDYYHTIDATMERNYNFSRYDHLWRLELRLYHPFVEWPWIPYILSPIVSKSFQALSVMLVLQSDRKLKADDLDEMLTTMEHDGVMARLDSVLQEKYVSSTAVSPGVCLGILDKNSVRRSDGELSGVCSAFGERYDRWDELVKQGMPRSHGQGILSTVHDLQAYESWREDTRRIHTSMQAEQKQAAGEEVYPRGEGQDNKCPRGGTD